MDKLGDQYYDPFPERTYLTILPIELHKLLARYIHADNYEIFLKLSEGLAINAFIKSRGMTIILWYLNKRAECETIKGKAAVQHFLQEILRTRGSDLNLFAIRGFQYRLEYGPMRAVGDDGDIAIVEISGDNEVTLGLIQPTPALFDFLYAFVED